MKKYRLLCVDDDELMVSSLRRVLRNEQWQVDLFVQAHDALKALDGQPYDVILCDYNMPMINGVQFLEYAKAKSPDTPRIILSGGLDVSVLSGAINKASVFGVLAKPWKNDQLIDMIQRAIGERNKSRKNAAAESLDALFEDDNSAHD